MLIHVHRYTDVQSVVSLVWGLLRLAPTMHIHSVCLYVRRWKDVPQCVLLHKALSIV